MAFRSVVAAVVVVMGLGSRLSQIQGAIYIVAYWI